MIGALLMTGIYEAVIHADNLLSRVRPENDQDEQILFARLKVAQLIENSIRIPLPEFLQTQSEVWCSVQRSLSESLTPDERKNIGNPQTLGGIIKSVLIPDTLMMGMHPLQASVLEKRPDIAFNPRIHFVDMVWDRDYAKEDKRTLPPEILRDWTRRVFSLNYSDSQLLDPTPYSRFIAEHDRQYQRIVTDFSSLCDVKGFLYLQRVLKPECHLYVEDHDPYIVNQIPYKKMSHSTILNERRIESMKKKGIVPGKMTSGKWSPSDLSQVPSSDHWFLMKALYPMKSREEQCYFYKRTDLDFDPYVAPAPVPVPVPITEITLELIEKALLKLREFEGDQARVINILIGKDTNRIQATKAVEAAVLQVK